MKIDGIAPPKPIAVTELTERIGSNLAVRLEKLCDSIFTCCKVGSADVPVVTRIQNDTEFVADITGLAITAMYETRQNLKCTISNILTEQKPEWSVPRPESISDFLRLATNYEAHSSRYHNRRRQIHAYDWVTSGEAAQMMRNLSALIPQCKLLEFEISVSRNVTRFGYDITINGRLDAYHDGTIYEFKVCQSIALEHKLQLIIYSWMPPLHAPWHASCLYNIKSGEAYWLKDDRTTINIIMDHLLANKYSLRQIKTDEEFINECIVVPSQKIKCKLKTPVICDIDDEIVALTQVYV